MKLKLILTTAVVVATAGLLGAAPAQAAPPPNDTFAGAKVISSLPFSDTLDTTQATADQTDAQVASGCQLGGVVLSTSVWYCVRTLDGRERQHRRQRVELFHRAGRRHRCAGQLYARPVLSWFHDLLRGPCRRDLLHRRGWTLRRRHAEALRYRRP